MANSPSTQLFKDDEQEKPGTGSLPDNDELRHVNDVGESDAERSQLKQAEEQGVDSSDNETADDEIDMSEFEQEFAEAGDSDQVGKGFNGAGGKKKTWRQRHFQQVGGRKKYYFLGIGGGLSGIIIVLIILLLIASSLKIPNLAQHITTYEFARVTRQMAQSTQRVTEQEVVLAASEDGTTKSLYSAFKEHYGNATGKVKGIWSKLDDYRPQKVINNMGNKNGLQFTYSKQGQLLGGTIDSATFTIERQGASRFIPGLNKLITFKNGAQFSRDFVPALQTSMRANEIGPIMRGATAREIRHQLGISLLAWNLGKFQGKDGRASRLEEARQKFKKINSSLVDDTPITAELADAAAADTKETQTAVASDTTLQAAIDNGGVVKGAQQALDKALTDSGAKIALGIVDPLYSIAMPICIVFDGSTDTSGPSINNNTQQAQAAYFFVGSVGAQEQEGTTNKVDATNLAKAVNAANKDLGNISSTPAEVKAGGGMPNTTTSIISPEAGASGQFTLLDATPGIGQYLGTLDSIATHTCGAVTNTALGIAIGIGNIALAIASFGSAAAAERATGQAAIHVSEEVSAGIFERLIARIGLDQFANNSSRVGKLLYGTGKDAAKNAAGIAAATVMAKLIVMNRDGTTNGGLTQGPDLAVEAAAGGAVQSGELSRKQDFGRPLTDSELGQSDTTDKQYVDAQNQSKSFTDRYFATSNANSLLSRMATGVSANFDNGVMTSLSKIGSSLLHPLSMVGSLFRSLNGKAMAAPDPNTQHYGVVQWGWSDDEERLIDSNPTYQLLANQEILDASGKQNDIATKYAVCFGYQAPDSQGNITLDPDNNGPGSLGSLLASGDITRDKDGNVLDNGSLCSPSSLGYNNTTDSLAIDSNGGPKTRDMIFRWRLAMRYAHTLDQLTGEQNVQL